MNKYIISLLGIAFAISLSACMNTTSVPMGNGRFAVSSDGNSFVGSGTVTTSALSEAAEDCANAGYNGFDIVDSQTGTNYLVNSSGAYPKPHSTFIVQCHN